MNRVYTRDGAIDCGGIAVTLNEFIFAVFPYVAIVLALVVTPLRYFTNCFSYSYFLAVPDSLFMSSAVYF
jgi:hypothetical protein